MEKEGKKKRKEYGRALSTKLVEEGIEESEGSLTIGEAEVIEERDNARDGGSGTRGASNTRERDEVHHHEEAWRKRR